MIIQGKKVDVIIAGKNDYAITINDYETEAVGDVDIRFIRYNGTDVDAWSLEEFEKLPSQREETYDDVLASLVRDRGKVAVIKQICDMDVESERK